MLIIWQKHKATQWWEEYSFCCIVCVCILKHNSLQPWHLKLHWLIMLWLSMSFVSQKNKKTETAVCITMNRHL